MQWTVGLWILLSLSFSLIDSGLYVERCKSYLTFENAKTGEVICYASPTFPVSDQWLPLRTRLETFEEACKKMKLEIPGYGFMDSKPLSVTSDDEWNFFVDYLKQRKGVFESAFNEEYLLGFENGTFLDGSDAEYLKTLLNYDNASGLICGAVISGENFQVSPLSCDGDNYSSYDVLELLVCKARILTKVRTRRTSTTATSTTTTATTSTTTTTTTSTTTRTTTSVMTKTSTTTTTTPTTTSFTSTSSPAMLLASNDRLFDKAMRNKSGDEKQMSAIIRIYKANQDTSKHISFAGRTGPSWSLVTLLMASMWAIVLFRGF